MSAEIDASSPPTTDHLFQVYLDKNGHYYRAQQRRDPGDSLVPSPSPALHQLLKDSAQQLGMSEIPYQQTWDAISYTDQSQSQHVDGGMPAAPPATLLTNPAVQVPDTAVAEEEQPTAAAVEPTVEPTATPAAEDLPS